MMWAGGALVLAMVNAKDHPTESFAHVFALMLLGVVIIASPLALIFGGLYLICRPTPEHDNG